MEKLNRRSTIKLGSSLLVGGSAIASFTGLSKADEKPSSNTTRLKAINVKKDPIEIYDNIGVTIDIENFGPKTEKIPVFFGTTGIEDLSVEQVYDDLLNTMNEEADAKERDICNTTKATVQIEPDEIKEVDAFKDLPNSVLQSFCASGTTGVLGEETYTIVASLDPSHKHRDRERFNQTTTITIDFPQDENIQNSEDSTADTSSGNNDDQMNGFGIAGAGISVAGTGYFLSRKINL